MHIRLSNNPKNKKEILKNQLLYFYVQLFKYNKDIHDNITKEINNEFKATKGIIKDKLKIPKVYKEVYKNLIKLKFRLLKVILEYDKYKSENMEEKEHSNVILGLTKKLNSVCKLLECKEPKIHFEKLLFLRTVYLFRYMLESSKKLAELIIRDINLIEKGKIGEIEEHKRDKSYKVAIIILKQIGALRDYALFYSKFIIHNEPFYIGKKKHIIITHDVKPVF